LVREFRDTVEVAGRAPAMVKLAEQADSLVDLIDAVAVEIEVLAVDLEPQWAAVVAQWLKIDGEELLSVVRDGTDIRKPVKLSYPMSVVRMRHGRKPVGRQVGERVPPILVVAHSSAESPGDELIEEIIQEIKHRPLTLIAAPDGSDWAQALAALGSREAWICKTMPLESLATKDLEGSLTRPPWLQAGQLACAWSVSGALASMHSAFAVTLEREDRSLQSKRAALEQHTSASQAEGASPTELLGEVRSYIQKQFDGFSKGVVSRLEGLVAPHEGSLRLEIEATINAIDDFDYVKKPKVFAVKVPPAIEKGMLSRIKETLAEVGRSDVQQLGELFQTVRSTVEEMVESKGGPPVTLHLDPVEQKTFDNILDRAVVLQRPYKGELVRKGALDFFMQARRYSMMFFMVLSAFGLSFVRQYKEVTVPLTMLLLMFGLLNVVNNARKQASENKEKELNKAKDSLRADMGRGMQDVLKNWGQTVSNHLSAEQGKGLELIENGVKAAAAEASRTAAEKKELYAKQLKGLDNSQRKVTEGVKKSEIAAKDLEVLTEQLVEFYAGMVSPPADPAAVPGMPGVPGVPGVARPPAAAVPRPAIPGIPGVPGVPGAAAPGAATPTPEVAAALKKMQEIQKKGVGAPAGAVAARSPAAPARSAGPAAGGPASDAMAKAKQLQAEAAERLRKAKAGGKPAAGGAAARKPAPASPGSAAQRGGGAATKKPGGAAADRLEELKKKMRDKKSSSSPNKPKPPSRGS